MNIIAYSLAVLNNGRLDLNKFAIIIGTRKKLMKNYIRLTLIKDINCAELDGDVLVPKFPCHSLVFGTLYALLVKGEVTISFKDDIPYVLMLHKKAKTFLVNLGVAYVVRKTKDEVTLALNPVFRRKIETLLELVNSI